MGTDRSGLCVASSRVGAMLIAAAAAMPVVMFQLPDASATTYTWTRGAGNNNWDNNTNWFIGSSPATLGAPPVIQAAANTTDIIFVGNLGTNTSSSMRQDYAVDSITFGSTLTNTATFSLTTAATLLNTNTLSAHLTLGAGGIRSDVTTYNLAIARNNAGISAELRLAANQTWQLNAPALSSNAATFTVSRVIAGAPGVPANSTNITKAGTGVLVLQSSTNTWAGGLTLSEGSVRTGGLSTDPNGHFGAGPITSTSGSDVSITASTVNSQGGNRRFDNSLVLGGTGRLNFGGSFELGFTSLSTWQLVGDKRLGVSILTDHQGTISGNFGLTKLGGGLLVLNNTATYTGATVISEGAVRIRNTTALGEGAAGVSVTATDGTNSLGGSLELDGGITVFTKPLSLAGNGANVSPTGSVTPTGGALRNLSGNNVWAGLVTLTGPVAVVRADAGRLSLPGGVTGSATSSLTVTSGVTGSVSVSRIQTGGALTVSDGATLTATATATVANVNRVGSLVLPTATSRFDLQTNDLIVGNGDLAAVTQFIRDGKLFSSVANTNTGDPRDSFATLGAISNNVGGFAYYAAFDGVSVSAGDVLVKYTYRGDTNLDGILDGQDLINIIEGFSNGLTGWANGDIDYSGSVTQIDWTLFSTALFNYSSPFPGGGSGRGDTTGVVPEPAAAGLFALGLPFVAWRRVRR